MEKRKWTRLEIEAFRKSHGNGFYFNKEDSNLLVPKSYGIGRTFNWANPISWVVMAVLIGLIIYSLLTR